MGSIAAPPSLYHFGRSKRIYLVRHAQGMHNVESDASRDPLTSAEFFDARLSPLGRQQVADQRKYVRESGLLDNVGVVIVSPMLRTLQTAVGIFGGVDQQDPLDVASSEDSTVVIDKTLTTSVSRPLIVACELCRERMGKYECDKRRSISEYQDRFPMVDFLLIENKDEISWNPNERETLEEVRRRVIKFLNWLWERKEEEIAVVSHGVFLQQAMMQLTENSNRYPNLLVRGHPMNLDYEPCSRFKNCEIRPVIIFPGSMMMGLGSESMICKQKYCGRIEKDGGKDSVPVEEVEVRT